MSMICPTIDFLRGMKKEWRRFRARPLCSIWAPEDLPMGPSSCALHAQDVEERVAISEKDSMRQEGRSSRASVDQALSLSLSLSLMRQGLVTEHEVVAGLRWSGVGG